MTVWVCIRRERTWHKLSMATGDGSEVYLAGKGEGWIKPSEITRLTFGRPAKGFCNKCIAGRKVKP